MEIVRAGGLLVAARLLGEEDAATRAAAALALYFLAQQAPVAAMPALLGDLAAEARRRGLEARPALAFWRWQGADEGETSDLSPEDRNLVLLVHALVAPQRPVPPEAALTAADSAVPGKLARAIALCPDEAAGDDLRYAAERALCALGGGSSWDLQALVDALLRAIAARLDESHGASGAEAEDGESTPTAQAPLSRTSTPSGYSLLSAASEAMLLDLAPVREAGRLCRALWVLGSEPGVSGTFWKQAHLRSAHARAAIDAAVRCAAALPAGPLAADVWGWLATLVGEPEGAINRALAEATEAARAVFEPRAVTAGLLRTLGDPAVLADDDGDHGVAWMGSNAGCLWD